VGGVLRWLSVGLVRAAALNSRTVHGETSQEEFDQRLSKAFKGFQSF
jgi:hypothetical protein